MVVLLGIPAERRGPLMADRPFIPKKSGPPPLPECVPRPAKPGAVYHPVQKPFGSGGPDAPDAEVAKRRAGVAQRIGKRAPFM